jgi:23S rRNA (pseudouridine1915-N3)-methyltransferase
MTIRIISVGKKHASWVNEGIERYSKRIHKPCDVKWVILPSSPNKTANACLDESGRILNHFNDDDYVIVLDEKGKIIDSNDLSKLLSQQMTLSKNIVFVIGGAYGVHDSLLRRANFIWSLSKLVFPHQLVRLILTEQIYRAQEISAGRPYHHD